MNVFSNVIGSFDFTGDCMNDAYQFLVQHHLPAVAEHSKRVSQEAERLAKECLYPEHKAAIAGILHDISAVFPSAERLSVAQELGIPVLDEEIDFPMLLHQKISKVMAQDLFQIRDLEILNAIECHTTLRKNPGQLDLILFVADKIKWDQEGTPPYVEELNRALHDSITSAAYCYIHYLMLHKNELKVVHLWLSEAYLDLEKRVSF